MNWQNKTLYGFDTETTSRWPHEARILTAALVKIEDGKVVRTKEYIFNPGVEIPQESIEIHGMTQEYIEEHGVPIEEGFKEFYDVFYAMVNSGVPLVAFNVAYDMTVINQEARRQGLPLLTDIPEEKLHRILDPFVLGKGHQHFLLENYQKGQRFRLTEMTELYNVEFENAHAADADAVGATKLLIAIINSSKFFQKMGPAQLFNLQKKWRWRQQSSLRKYFEKNDVENDGVDESWPIYSGA